MRIPIVAGNWKMYKTIAEAVELTRGVRRAVADIKGVEVVLCPPFTALAAVREAIGPAKIGLGAQNMHFEEQGAFTGEISPLMLAELCQYVILGHSERRQYFGETDETVNKRLKAALAAKLKPILCVGEMLAEREAGVTRKVVQRQVEAALAGLTAEDMASLTIAYEPVWAIGTGRTATPEQAQEVQAFIRGLLGRAFGAGVAETTRIQYGGSVNAGNARALLSQPDIDGALVGGASLKTDEFARIVLAAGRPGV